MVPGYMATSLSISFLQILQQAIKYLLIGLWVFPVGKITNMSCGLKRSCPLACTLEYLVIETNRKEDLALLANFSGERKFNFVANLSTVDSVLRENEEELVLHMNGLINILTHIITRLEVVWGKPASHAIGLQISMETASQRLVFAGIRNETGMVLDRVHHRGAIKVDPLIWNTNTT